MTRHRLLPAATLLVVGILVVGVGATLARRDEADQRRPTVGAEPQASGEAIEGETQDSDELTPEAIDRIIARLEAAGIETDAATVEALAGELGVGGAIRALAWSDATDGAVSAQEIADLRAEGIGWGRLRRQLDPDGSFGLHPGIGHIMGGGHGNDDGPASADDQARGNGNGNGNANGHDKQKPKKGGDEPAS